MKMIDKAAEGTTIYDNEEMAYLNLYEALDRNDDSAAFGYAYYLADPFVNKEKTSFPEWLTEEKSEQIINMIKEHRIGKTDSVSSTVWKLVYTVKELWKNRT